MPLLILTLVAPLVIFFAFVATCAWLMRRESLRAARRSAARAERHAWNRPPRSRAFRARRFTVVPVDGAFDPDCALLWETQVAALQLLSAAGDEGITPLSLRPLFEQESRRYPELYDGARFEEWLAFLQETEMAERRDAALVITHVGREFLLFQEQRHWTRFR